MEMKFDKLFILNLHDQRACFKEATAYNQYLHLWKKNSCHFSLELFHHLSIPVTWVKVSEKNKDMILVILFSW